MRIVMELPLQQETTLAGETTLLPSLIVTENCLLLRSVGYPLPEEKVTNAPAVEPDQVFCDPLFQPTVSCMGLLSPFSLLTFTLYLPEMIVAEMVKTAVVAEQDEAGRTVTVWVTVLVRETLQEEPLVKEVPVRVATPELVVRLVREGLSAAVR